MIYLKITLDLIVVGYKNRPNFVQFKNFPMHVKIFRKLKCISKILISKSPSSYRQIAK